MSNTNLTTCLFMYGAESHWYPKSIITDYPKRIFNFIQIAADLCKLMSSLHFNLCTQITVSFVCELVIYKLISVVFYRFQGKFSL